MTTDEGLRYPLQWPPGRERTPDDEREVSRFKYNLYGATEDMLDELERLGAEHPVISCNIRPRGKKQRDEYSGMSTTKAPPRPLKMSALTDSSS